jgi:hypothetical protein
MIRTYLKLWNEAGEEEPVFPQHYSRGEQRGNEQAADCIIADIDRERNPEGIRQHLRRLARECAAARDYRLRMLESDEVWDVTQAFIRRARSFDRRLDAEALGQALRNVWVMNWIQIALGRPVTLTDSVFAYSLLYPYTDNYFDGAADPGSKRLLAQRLRSRLEGLELAAAGPLEKRIFGLVGLIELDWQRSQHPEVYLSLLAIHDAQLNSMRHQRPGPADAALLAAEVYKGGSSVLADACLVVGDPGSSRSEFFFGLGVLLQFLDDLQDQTVDAACGQRTIFTCAECAPALDRITSRYYHFLGRVLDGAVGKGAVPEALLVEVHRSCSAIMLMAVATNAARYTRRYRLSLEKYSPVSFAYLNKIHSRVSSLRLVRMLCPPETA